MFCRDNGWLFIETVKHKNTHSPIQDLNTQTCINFNVIFYSLSNEYDKYVTNVLNDNETNTNM